MPADLASIFPPHYGYGEIFKKQANHRTGRFEKTGQPPYVLAALPEPVPARNFTRRFLLLGTLMVIAMLPRRTYPFRTVIQFSRFTRNPKCRFYCIWASKSVRILQQKKALSRISKRMEKTLDFSNFHGYRQP